MASGSHRGNYAARRGAQLPRGGRHALRRDRRWARVNGRAVQLTLCSFVLPVPVAVAAPNVTSLADDVLMTRGLPVIHAADQAASHQRPVSRTAAPDAVPGPFASVTDVPATDRRAVSASRVAAHGVPAAALRAYRNAAATLDVADPGCRLDWTLLAGIGRVESDHGRYGGAVLGQDGQSSPRIVGVPLDGAAGVAAIADTDGGALDGDRRWDRAVGPLQFIPSTWSMVGVDGDGDGTRNPHDIDDAALAAAAYLCVGDEDLSTTAGAQQAVFTYNHSDEYVATVLGVANAYEHGSYDLAALATNPLLATGPGVTVDLSGTGHGVAVGATDDVSGADRDGRTDRGRTDDDTTRRAPKHRGADRTENDDASTAEEPRSPGRHVKTSPADEQRTSPKKGDPVVEQDPVEEGPAVEVPATPQATTAPEPAAPSEAAETAEPEAETAEPAAETAEPGAPPTEYTGTLTECGDGYCLDDHVLDWPQVDAGLVGQAVTVVGTLHDGVLIVDDLVA